MIVGMLVVVVRVVMLAIVALMLVRKGGLRLRFSQIVGFDSVRRIQSQCLLGA